MKSATATRSLRRYARLAGTLLLVAFNHDGFAQQQQERMSWEKFREDPARVEALRKGIRAMKGLPNEDPRSWFFQANIHDEADPENHADWSKCEHGTWHFFTWHRMYIHFFEDVLRKYAENDTLRLPYWNWEAPANRGLPAEFREPKESDGVTENHLYVAERQMNNPRFRVRWQQASYDRQMQNTTFIGLVVAGTFLQGFGGGGRALNTQERGDIAGTFEAYPHGALHGDIGGRGWMGNTTTAAQDPIFWLHHVNIDRQWERWRGQPGRIEPTGAWRTEPYWFYDREGQRKRVIVEEFLDLGRLPYKYDDVPPATPRVQPLLAPLQLALAATDKAAPDGGPAATAAPSLGQLKVLTLAKPKITKPISIKGIAATIEIGQAADLSPRWKALLSEPRAPTPARVFLRLEGVKFSERPTYNLEVYLNKRDASASTKAGDPQYAGTISFFSATHKGHHGEEGGRTFRFDVSECLINAKKASGYDASNLAITVVPVGPETEDGATPPTSPVEISIEKVALETITD